MSPKIFLVSFYNPYLQLSTHFYAESSYFIAFSSLKIRFYYKYAGISRVLKNRELQIREIQGRELQGLPV